ncbi:MAG: S46 family peptidase [Archangiaceae bacterium]|nr:S46 family peptidase [Archangiaceae bacterium]
MGRVLAFLFLPALAFAGEGKWTPQQVLELGPAWVKSQGFALPLEKLWSEKKGGGLLGNAVALPGCTGSFVSPQGLLITNHHCVVGVLQQHSTPENNLYKSGYLARNRGEEKRAAAFRIQIPRAFHDVTREVRASIPEGADDLERFRAIEAKQKALVAECEKKPATRCQFAAFDSGLFYTVTESLELSDVRLVYAPPRGVGDYGGEVDNWTWPRHTGDFALLRAYDGKGDPFVPDFWFPVSPRGVKAGDGVAVLGYPAASYRSFLASEMEEREQFWFPRLEELTREWSGLMERMGQASPQTAVAVADDAASLSNRRKNAEGELAGLKRGQIVEKQRALESKVLGWLARHPEMRAAQAARDALQGVAQERLATWEHDFLLDVLTFGPRGTRWGVAIARRAAEAQKPDIEREPGFQERDLQPLRERLERDQKRFDRGVDEEMFFSWVKRALQLPREQRIAAVQERFGSASDDVQVKKRIAEMYRLTRLTDVEERKRMFDEPVQVLLKRPDPLMWLSLELDEERRALKERRDRWAGASARNRPEWRRAVIAQAGAPLAPDANGTLRVTFGRVRGYAPRDGVSFAPVTRLGGVLEKHTGEEPFAVPDAVLKAARAGKTGRWKDAHLGDVPVDFLSDCDTSGGNSGSPVIDGQGNLVGVNFDRVWENVANDFGYNPDVARNIVADVRYLLWLLDQVEGAGALVSELTQGKGSP